MVSYREFRYEDISEVLKMWKETDGVKLHDNGEDSEEGIGNCIHRNKGLSLIAEDNGAIVGAVLNGQDGRRGYVYHLIVKEDYRKQGIASQLLKLTESAMNDVGIHKLALFVLKDNVVAQEFYRAIEWNQEDVVNVFSKVI